MILNTIKNILLTLILSSFYSLCSFADGYLKFIHFNVGQGDASLVIGANGTTVMIDAGHAGAAEEKILPALNAMGVKHLDYIIATHFHRDHIAGYSKLKHLTSKKTIIYDRDGCAPHDLESHCEFSKRIVTLKGNLTSYGKYKKSLKGVFTKVHKSTEAINLGNGAKLSFLAVGGKLTTQVQSQNYNSKAQLAGMGNENAASIAIKISYGDFQYFTAGDLTGGGRGGPDVERRLLPVVGDVDVFHSNHHGSATSNSKNFLNSLKPEVGLVSVGYKNQYSLPSPEVISRFRWMWKRGDFKYLFMTTPGNLPIGSGWKNENNAGTGRDEYSFISIATEHITLYAAKDHYIINGVIMPVDERIKG